MFEMVSVIEIRISVTLIKFIKIFLYFLQIGPRGSNPSPELGEAAPIIQIQCHCSLPESYP